MYLRKDLFKYQIVLQYSQQLIQ